MLLIEHQTPIWLVHINTQPDPIMFRFLVYQQQGRAITLLKQGNFFVYHDTMLHIHLPTSSLVIDNSPYSYLTIPFPGLAQHNKPQLLSFIDTLKHHARRRT